MNFEQNHFRQASLPISGRPIRFLCRQRIGAGSAVTTQISPRSKLVVKPDSHADLNNPNAEIISDHLRNGIETSGEVIFLTDRQGVITYVNPQFTQLYGYTIEEVVGKTTPRILRSGKTTQQDYELFWNKLLAGESVKCEFLNLVKDGKLVSIESSASPILDDGGNIVGFLAIQSDITERKHAEADIKQREKELIALNAVAAIVGQSLDLKQILHGALDEVLRLKIFEEQMFGMLFLLDETHQTLHLAAQRGTPAGHPCLSRPVNVGECLCGLAVQNGKVIVCQSNLDDARHTRSLPEIFLHKDICIPIKAHGSILGVMEIRLPGAYEIPDTDILILQAVADQIGIAIENARLRELRERATIEERERIARELHDGLYQLLGYINTKAMAARLQLRKHRIQAADQLLLQLEEAAKESFVDVREAILGLKMAGHSGVGLTANLNNFIAHSSRLSGLPIELSIDPQAENIPLNAETEYQIMRIVQEALNNVRKHASANHAWVHVELNNNLLVLCIGDDGVGFDPHRTFADHSRHLGLETMRERAESIGARFQIESGPQRGAQVQLYLPISAEESQ